MAMQVPAGVVPSIVQKLKLTPTQLETVSMLLKLNGSSEPTEQLQVRALMCKFVKDYKKKN